MADRFSFSLEKLELLHRIRVLEQANGALTSEVERLKLQNELLRDDMRAFAERQARPRVLATDGRGGVISG